MEINLKTKVKYKTKNIFIHEAIFAGIIASAGVEVLHHAKLAAEILSDWLLLLLVYLLNCLMLLH